MTPLPLVAVLRDATARVQRAREAFSDGDREFAEQVLDDLVHELWLQVERLEREAASPR
jgi:hypothetical protein